jgi:hydroxyisourate hydrolase
MTLADFSALSKAEAGKQLVTCCGSSKWVEKMLQEFPFASERRLLQTAQDIWYGECNESDWQEAFTHHPKIGETNLAEKFAATQHLAGKEQEGVNDASAEMIKELAKANREYEAKTGFIFIVCASGRSAGEMLRLLKDRLRNSLREELQVAMGEQYKITMLRLQKLLEITDTRLPASQLTTHVLDTSAGKPGQDITIRLQRSYNGIWETFAQGVTNADGRIGDLLPPGRTIAAANYKMIFETGDYFIANKIKGFYPEVEIQFTVFDGKHYHVPLLINPFGYSTYRGS